MRVVMGRDGRQWMIHAPSMINFALSQALGFDYARPLPVAPVDTLGQKLHKKAPVHQVKVAK